MCNAMLYCDCPIEIMLANDFEPRMKTLDVVYFDNFIDRGIAFATYQTHQSEPEEGEHSASRISTLAFALLLIPCLV